MAKIAENDNLKGKKEALEAARLQIDKQFGKGSLMKLGDNKETLDVEDLAGGQAGGWYLVCVDGFPLGWGKVSRGILKNKYLPGWRICG